MSIQQTAVESEGKPKKKLSFKQQMMLAREQAVVDTVYSLLATKGYDSMTVDEVAAEVGIAKASLYRHFPSKEALAVAAMVHAMNKAIRFVDGLDKSLEPIDLLKKTTYWVMELKVNNQMPTLPSENSVLRNQLMKSAEYMDGLMYVSDLLGSWIESAQESGTLNKGIPPIVILYTLYARACDPVLDFLKQSKLYTDEQVLEFVMKTCFDGLAAK